MTPEVLIGLLAEPTRMRIFAAVVLGAGTPNDAVSQANVTIREGAEALRRLGDGGLITNVNGALVAHVEIFKETMKEYGQRPAEPLDPDSARASVLRAFVVDGKLVTIPAAQGKRRVILEHIVAGFEPGVRYQEREVDAVLRAWHPDHAALRRYLIDEDLMARDRATYWRIGGPVL
jgi:hypothetical protein